MASHYDIIPIYPIEKFFWERSNATLSVSHKDLNWPNGVALPDKIQIRGKVALTEFYFNQLSRSYCYNRTLEIYNPQEYNVKERIMHLTKVLIL